MTKEERYELLDYMEQSQDLNGELNAKDYIREMWLDLGDCMNDIEEALYKILAELVNK